MCSLVVAAVLIARFGLLAAVGDRRMLVSQPVALAPELGGRQAIGEASGPAEAYGVRAGMSLSEALLRCPELALVPPDPARAEAAWEEILRRLEGIGAAVEPGRAGEAFFETAGLRGLWGDSAGVLAKAREDVGVPARLGAGPTRFCAYAAARAARPRSRRRRGRTTAGAGDGGHREPILGTLQRGPGGSVIVPKRELRLFLAPLPLEILRDRLASFAATGSAAGAAGGSAAGPAALPLGRGAGAPISAATAAREEREAEKFIAALERLGIRTLGKLTALPRDAFIDRFGPLGRRAHEWVSGEEDPLRPRRAREELVQWLDLPEAASGQQLAHALGLLVDRLLALPARRQRTIRALRLEARLAAGGSWRMDATPRQASGSAERLRLVLGPHLDSLPGPVAALGRRQRLRKGHRTSQHYQSADRKTLTHCASPENCHSKPKDHHSSPLFPLYRHKRPGCLPGWGVYLSPRWSNPRVRLNPQARLCLEPSRGCLRGKPGTSFDTTFWVKMGTQHPLEFEAPPPMNQSERRWPFLG